MNEERFIMPNWFREKRSHFQNNVIYNFLRLAGFSVKESQAMRHWGIPKIKRRIAAIEQSKD